MSLNDAPLALTFDDVTLAPVHSTVKSRKEPDVTTKIGFITYKSPIVSSPMNTVTEEEMVYAVKESGGEAVVHRYMSIPQQLEIIKKINDMIEGPLSFDGDLPYFAIGATGDHLERFDELYKAGVRKFCIDVANGHSEICVDATNRLSQRKSDAIIMAGSVCNSEGAYRLLEAGARVIRVGIGNGSMCITRLVTGHGIPQMTALEDVCTFMKEDGWDDRFGVIADGGIRHSGDIIKALAIGADAVMLGNLLAGTEESPGQTHKDPETGELYKIYAGMASEEGRSEWFDRAATSFVPEGVSTKMPFKGSAYKILDNLIGGLKTGMSWSNARTLEELRKNAKWVRVSNAGHSEGLPRR